MKRKNKKIMKMKMKIVKMIKREMKKMMMKMKMVRRIMKMRFMEWYQKIKRKRINK
jgi:hypothetical protein